MAVAWYASVRKTESERAVPLSTQNVPQHTTIYIYLYADNWLWEIIHLLEENLISAIIIWNLVYGTHTMITFYVEIRFIATIMLNAIHFENRCMDLFFVTSCVLQLVMKIKTTTNISWILDNRLCECKCVCMCKTRFTNYGICVRHSLPSRLQPYLFHTVFFFHPIFVLYIAVNKNER